MSNTMCPDSEFQEKMGILDLIINVLKEHEENLDRLADKLERVLKSIISVESKILGLNETFAQALLPKAVNPEYLQKPAALLQCREWAEFKNRSVGAHMVAFEVEGNAFTVNSMSGTVVYRYSEFLPEVKFQVEKGERRLIVKKLTFDSPGDLFPVFEKRLKCGLEVSVQDSGFDLSESERLLKLMYHVDPVTAKRWLSTELGVPEESIIEGSLVYSSR